MIFESWIELILSIIEGEMIWIDFEIFLSIDEIDSDNLLLN